MGKRLNIGAGGDIRGGWENLDKVTIFGASAWDFDVEKLSRYGDNEASEIFCRGCLNEFISTPIDVMSEFWRVLENGGKLTVVVAVVDNGKGAHRDPLARRYLYSEWVQYFCPEFSSRYAGGVGMGFVGSFRIIENEVAGEVHTVVLEALK